MQHSASHWPRGELQHQAAGACDPIAAAFAPGALHDSFVVRWQVVRGIYDKVSAL